MQENTFSLNRTLGLAIAVIALVAVIGGSSVLISLSQLGSSIEARYRSTQVVSGLETFRAAMLNQETGLRGYLLTGQEVSLDPFNTGRLDLNRAVDALHGLIRSDDPQRVNLNAAISEARAWQTEVAEPIIRTMAEGRPEEARRIEETGTGRARFDAFRTRLAAIGAQERRSLDEQSVAVTRSEWIARVTMWASLVITFLICIGAGLAISALITRPLVQLAAATRRLVQRDTSVTIPSLGQRNEVGAMARAVAVFRDSLVELDRTSMLRVTADTMPAMIGYIGADRKVAFLNQEFTRRFDLGAQDVATVSGQDLDEVFPHRTFPGVASELQAALSGTETHFAFQLAQNGAQRDFEGYFRPHQASDGRVLGVVALFTDVTDRREIDRRLRHQAHDLQRSNEELEQFAYVASHDLKAPLRGIENLATWIQEDLGDTLQGDPRHNMELLRSRVRRLESLLNDLLAYSRAGRGENVIRDVDTAELVDELAALVSPPAGFRIHGGSELPRLQAAQAPLAQVLQNLISNAIKHHPDPANGFVEINARRNKDYYQFEVADNGSGIPEQFRQRVFGMFQTLRPRDEVEGSGMGLAIVRKLVERQTGEVWLSEREAGGLVVHFTWPAEPKED